MARITNYRRSGIVHLTFQVFFLLIFYLFGTQSISQENNLIQIVVFGIITLAPSIVWGIFFHLQDWKETEPTRYLVTSFLSGIAGAASLMLVFKVKLFNVDAWIHMSWWSLILGSV